MVLGLGRSKASRRSAGHLEPRISCGGLVGKGLPGIFERGCDVTTLFQIANAAFAHRVAMVRDIPHVHCRDQADMVFMTGSV